MQMKKCLFYENYPVHLFNIEALCFPDEQKILKNTCNKKFAVESCPKISFLPGILTKNIFRKIKNFSENFFDLKSK